MEAEKKLKDLSIENFPDLNSQKENISSSKKSVISFLDKVKAKVVKEETNSEKDLDIENLKPGWILIKKDKETGKIITKSKEIYNQNDYDSMSERDIGINIINSLVNLHNKRTEEYIKLWGYDEWEKMFRFPNYDYEYFEKLDEQYEEEMAQLEEAEKESSEDDYYY